MGNDQTIIAVCGHDGVVERNVGSAGEESAFPTEMTDLADTWRSSESYFRSSGGSAFPTINITETTIWVYWAQTGSGNVTSTYLTGDGGTYTFDRPNQSYEVMPGRYTHRVVGTVVTPPGGTIASGIRYR